MGRRGSAGNWRALPEVRESEVIMFNVYYREEGAGTFGEPVLGALYLLEVEDEGLNELARMIQDVANRNRCFTAVALLTVRLERMDGKPYRVYVDNVVKAETYDRDLAIHEFIAYMRGVRCGTVKR